MPTFAIAIVVAIFIFYMLAVTARRDYLSSAERTFRIDTPFIFYQTKILMCLSWVTAIDGVKKNYCTRATNEISFLSLGVSSVTDVRELFIL